MTARESLFLGWCAIHTDCHPAARTFVELATGRRVVVTADHGFTVTPGWPAPRRPLPGAAVAFVRVGGLDATGTRLLDGFRSGSMPRAQFVERFAPDPQTFRVQSDAQRRRLVAPLNQLVPPIPFPPRSCPPPQATRPKP